AASDANRHAQASRQEVWRGVECTPGAGADVVGFGVDQLPREAVAQVIAAFPRMGFKKAYQKVLAEVVARKPETTPFTFLADIGERHVPGYNAPHFCDLMDNAPFAD